VPNGIQIVTIDLKVHILSHLMVAGHRALVSYEGQPLICYVCNETGHLVNECPVRHSDLLGKDGLGRESRATVTAGRKAATVVGGTDAIQTEVDGQMRQDRQDSLDDMVTEDTNRADHATEKRVFGSCERGLKQDSDMAGRVDTNTSVIETRTTGMMEESPQAGSAAEEPRGGEEGFFSGTLATTHRDRECKGR
jgi:hypothetical protein